MFLVHNNEIAIGVYENKDNLNDLLKSLNEDGIPKYFYKISEVKEIVFLDKQLNVTLNDKNLTELTLNLF